MRNRFYPWLSLQTSLKEGAGSRSRRRCIAPSIRPGPGQASARPDLRNRGCLVLKLRLEGEGVVVMCQATNQPTLSFHLFSIQLS